LAKAGPLAGLWRDSPDVSRETLRLVGFEGWWRAARTTARASYDAVIASDCGCGWRSKRGGFLARILAIANQKGGVGKTATAVNLSAALAEQGRRVLLLDLDSQASASTGVGVRAEPGRSSYEVLIGAIPARETLLATGVPGLTVLPSSRDLAGAEVELVEFSDRHTKLGLALAPIAEDFDDIIIDCPPALGMLTLNALCAADSVLVPLQCEFYALEGLSALLDTIGRIRGTFHADLELQGIVLTMYDARTSLSRQVASEIRSHFANRVFSAVVPRNVRISEAPSHGAPVLVYDPSSSGAAAYRQVAKELINQYLNEVLDSDEKGGPNGETSAR
jgi:chromosome partitioning protein